jgi:hypothetical protein
MKLTVGAAVLAPSLLTRASLLTMELTATIDRSRDLTWLSRRLRSLGSARVRSIAGGVDDPGLVLATIAGASLCPDCIARKTGMAAAEIDALLTKVASTIALTVTGGRCDACLESRTTYRLDGAAANGSSRPRTTQHAILAFLREHRNGAFCADCITRRLFEGRSIDVAMRHLEGNGVHRRHGQCSGCGKLRLVAGVPTAP